jgi:hypothetical protein
MTVAALFWPWEFANQLGQLLTAGAHILDRRQSAAQP